MQSQEVACLDSICHEKESKSAAATLNAASSERISRHIYALSERCATISFGTLGTIPSMCWAWSNTGKLWTWRLTWIWLRKAMWQSKTRWGHLGQKEVEEVQPTGRYTDLHNHIQLWYTTSWWGQKWSWHGYWWPTSVGGLTPALSASTVCRWSCFVIFVLLPFKFCRCCQPTSSFWWCNSLL